MTSEQIEELRQAAVRLPEVHYPPLATIGERESMWVRSPDYEKVKMLLPKLLDEREALLKATKDLRGLAYNLLRIVGDSVEKAEAHVSIAGADSAIAKAES